MHTQGEQLGSYPTNADLSSIWKLIKIRILLIYKFKYCWVFVAADRIWKLLDKSCFLLLRGETSLKQNLPLHHCQFLLVTEQLRQTSKLLSIAPENNEKIPKIFKAIQVFKKKCKDFQKQPGSWLSWEPLVSSLQENCLLEVMGVVKTKTWCCASGTVTASWARIPIQFAAKQFPDQWDLHMAEPLFVNHVLHAKASSLMWDQWESDTQVLLKILLSSYCICRFPLKSITLHLSLMGVESNPWCFLTFPSLLVSTHTYHSPQETETLVVGLWCRGTVGTLLGLYTQCEESSESPGPENIPEECHHPVTEHAALDI